MIPKHFHRLLTMSARQSELSANLKTIQAEIAGLKPTKSVQLVAVSKLKPASDINDLYKATGHTHFGENYIQELISKASELPKEITWHFIGGLQSNKCKQLAQSIPNLIVETVDSVKKANELNKGRQGMDQLEVYIQINTSSESEKSGIEEAEVEQLVEHIRNCENLRLTGLMTIGALASSTSASPNPDFEKLVNVRDRIDRGLKLSMGMSGDYSAAILAGTDSIRIGTAIFGDRPKKDSTVRSDIEKAD